MKSVTEVWPQRRKKESHYMNKNKLLYEKADSVTLRTRIENFYFYNCKQIVLQNWFHSKNGVIYHLSQSRAKKAVILHLVFYRLFAALLLKAHHQKMSSSCLSSPASNMLCGVTLNKGWWNDKKKWSVFNHHLWKWTGMRSTPGWSDTEREREKARWRTYWMGFSLSEFTADPECKGWGSTYTALKTVTWWQ